jgi:hypothetical protein
MPNPSQAAFLIRMWEEPREIAGQPPLRRGMIQYLHSGERAYFQDFAEMIAFINHRVSWETSPSGEQERPEN